MRACQQIGLTKQAKAAKQGDRQRICDGGDQNRKLYFKKNLQRSSPKIGGGF